MLFDCLARVYLLAAETAFAFEDKTARRMAQGGGLFKRRVRGNSNVKVNGIGSNAADGCANAIALTSAVGSGLSLDCFHNSPYALTHVVFPYGVGDSGRRKIRKAVSRKSFCLDSGLSSSSAISLVARSGSMTGQSVPNTTLSLPQVLMKWMNGSGQ